MVSSLAVWPSGAIAMIGRNEQCPCESGLKYKHYHGIRSSQLGNA